MDILIERKWKKPNYTIGKLFINGNFECNTLEDKDRGICQSMPVDKIKQIKVKNETAIPTGTYIVDMDTISPRYSQHYWYLKNCHTARLPRLKDVPGFDGVLIHVGNTAKDSSGCILVGKNDIIGQVTNSKEIFHRLYNKMYDAHIKGESIKITIK